MTNPISIRKNLTRYIRADRALAMGKLLAGGCPVDEARSLTDNHVRKIYRELEATYHAQNPLWKDAITRVLRDNIRGF